MAAERRFHRLGRAIAITLAVKFAALGVIWSVWFSDSDSRRVDAGRVAAALYSAPAAAPERRSPHAEP